MHLLDDFTIGEGTTLPALTARINSYFARPRANDTAVVVMGPSAYARFDIESIHTDAGWLLVQRNSALAPWLVEIRSE